MDVNKINLDEFKTIFHYIIDNNKRLVNEGKMPTAIALEADAGIGKTSTILQIAEEMNMGFIKLNLSQCEELGDLIGFPIKEYYVCSDDGDCQWVSSDLLAYYLQNGYKVQNMTRMSYAPPTWMPKEENEQGCILLLDDYSRALPMFLQATMELIDRGEYISWKLPKNCTIVLTSNPDNGDYNVTTMDNAQKTRYINFEIEFDVEVWARWAEREHLDSRAINFALLYPEIFDKEGNVQKINPRSYATFCNAISGLKDWNAADNLAMILNIAKGCFTSKENIIGNLFTTFINQKLDKLISPKDMLFESWDTVKTKIKNCVYENGVYRPDIASVLSTRLLNYSLMYFGEKGAKTEVVQDRLLDFINSPEVLLTEDLLFHLIKTITTKYSSRANKLIMNPKIRAKIL